MSTNPHCRERGLGLVELMVGMLVGLITTVVIFQVVQTAEQSKRITTAGSDIQAAGSMGLYFLERDLQQAGLGIGRIAPAAANCTVRALLAGAPINFQMRPVEITKTVGAADQLVVLVGNSAVSVGAVVYTGSGASGGKSSLTLASRAGYFDRDLFIAVPSGAPASDCTLSTVDSLPVDPLNPTLILHGASGVMPPTGYSFGAGGELFNLGPAPRLIRYRIETSTGRPWGLYATNLLAPGAAALEIGAGIIDMQAQYGYDTNGDNVIADGAASEWVTTLPVPTDWGRVLAIRVALLARSSERAGGRPGEPKATLVAPTWGGGTQTFNLMGSDWDLFRYRVYETTVTLRNVLWGAGS